MKKLRGICEVSECAPSSSDGMCNPKTSKNPSYPVFLEKIKLGRDGKKDPKSHLLVLQKSF